MSHSKLVLFLATSKGWEMEDNRVTYFKSMHGNSDIKLCFRMILKVFAQLPSPQNMAAVTMPQV